MSKVVRVREKRHCEKVKEDKTRQREQIGKRGTKESGTRETREIREQEIA